MSDRPLSTYHVTSTRDIVNILREVKEGTAPNPVLLEIENKTVDIPAVHQFYAYLISIPEDFKTDELVLGTKTIGYYLIYILTSQGEVEIYLGLIYPPITLLPGAYAIFKREMSEIVLPSNVVKEYTRNLYRECVHTLEKEENNDIRNGGYRGRRTNPWKIFHDIFRGGGSRGRS